MTVTSLWGTLEARLLPVFAEYRSRIAELPVEVKPDRTLLTEADVAVQKLIIDALRELEGDAVIIAEEDERAGVRAEVAASSGRVWVVDPIDGTAEFVRAERTEFCSVVCLLEDWAPVAAFVLAPELGAGRTPLVVTADVRRGQVELNGKPAGAASTRWISATRSAGDPPRPFDAAAEREGYRLKLRTTSQTLDMVRTVVDLADRTDPPAPGFDLFWRRDQKVWDGLAGLCLGAAAGLHSSDESGEPLPLGPELLSRAEPVFESTVMGRRETVEWFLEVTRG
ncbi:inositol monophosphatase family protein [Kitasatospora sp. NPDC049258]|uniref:inositol monophosphatase family protein n=1 Tax=Kitasatospora sp. NPDC049258 TaxID=3155394 RepID=UPI00342B0FB7